MDVLRLNITRAYWLHGLLFLGTKLTDWRCVDILFPVNGKGMQKSITHGYGNEKVHINMFPLIITENKIIIHDTHFPIHVHKQ